MNRCAGSLNVMTTSICNLRCAYCFAAGAMRKSGNKVMGSADFHRAVDYHARWELQTFKFVGGEPTLHPEFVEQLEVLSRADRIRKVFVYTNLSCEDTALRALMALSAAKEVELLVNVNPREDIGETLFQKVVSNLEFLKLERVLGRSRVGFAIGVNVYRPNFDCLYALDLCRRLQCNLRFSYVTPLEFSGIALREYFEVAAAFAVNLVECASANKVLAYVDCNYVPVCCYSEEQYRTVRTKANFDKTFCDLPTPLSITPDQTVAPCFVVEELGTLAMDLDVPPAEMARAMTRQLVSGTAPDLFAECRRCPLKRFQGAACGCPGFRKNLSRRGPADQLG